MQFILLETLQFGQKNHLIIVRWLQKICREASLEDMKDHGRQHFTEFEDISGGKSLYPNQDLASEVRSSDR